MTDFNYQALARKTNSPNFFLDRVDEALLARSLMTIIEIANKILDPIKKQVFYGKDVVLEHDAEPVYGLGYNPDAVPPDVFHAIIGIITESGELAEALFKAMFGGETFDLVNFREELGDIAWYRALGLGAAGSTPDENDRENIAKLMKRFRDKFTDEEANNRDLAAERIVLEGYTGTLTNASVMEWGPGHTRINGDLYQDKLGRFNEGENVTTSKVTGVDVAPDGCIVIETKSGSRYRVPDPIKGWRRDQLGDDLAQEANIVSWDGAKAMVTDVGSLILDKGPFKDPSGQDWLATSGGTLYRLLNYGGRFETKDGPAYGLRAAPTGEPDNGISRVE